MPTRFWSLEPSGSSSRPTNASSSSISPLSSPPSTSPSISPPSSRALTPPPRLHLRSLLSPTLPKEHWSRAPTIPYPWIWRCHLCNSWYRLGVTRRCLEDGHFFCSIPESKPSPVSPIDNVRDVEKMFAGEDVDADAEEVRRRKAEREKAEIEKKAAEKKRKGKGRRKVVRGCGAEFDYTGWAKYNTWRREVQTLKNPSSFSSKPPLRGPQHSRLERIKHWAGLATGDDGEAIGSGRGRRRIPKRNCWKDCDFPSECHNEREAEREWEARMRMERLREARELEARRVREMWWRDNEEDLGLSLPLSRAGGIEKDISLVVAWNDVVYHTDEVKKEKGHTEEVVHGKANLHSSQGTAVVLDDPNLGPLGTDCDGLGESAFQTPYITARRRKSIEEEKGGSPPSSPLKCSFDFKDVDLGIRERDFSEAKVWHIEGGRDADLQLREERASRGSNVLLRRVEVGDERFGDELEDD